MASWGVALTEHLPGLWGLALPKRKIVSKQDLFLCKWPEMICKEYFTIYLTWKAPQNHTYLEVQIIPEEKAVQEKKKKKDIPEETNPYGTACVS